MFIMESSKVLGYRVQCRGGGAQSNVSYTLLKRTIHRFSLQYKGLKVKGVQSRGGSQGGPGPTGLPLSSWRGGRPPP